MITKDIIKEKMLMYPTVTNVVQKIFTTTIATIDNKEE